jgi:hypothetical protein
VLIINKTLPQVASLGEDRCRRAHPWRGLKGRTA